MTATSASKQQSLSSQDAIEQLEDAKDALQKQCNAASGARVMQLMTVIHQIADEISATESVALANPAYIPSTDAFKQATADGQAFLTTLNSIKSAFSDTIAVAEAVDTIIGMVTKYVA